MHGWGQQAAAGDAGLTCRAELTSAALAALAASRLATLAARAAARRPAASTCSIGAAPHTSNTIVATGSQLICNFADIEKLLAKTSKASNHEQLISQASRRHTPGCVKTDCRLAYRLNKDGMASILCKRLGHSIGREFGQP